MMNQLRIPGFLFLLIFIFLGCRKESFTDDPSALLNTSVDSLHFDTIFTTTGSITQFVKIINENKKGIRINSVQLAGGDQSVFHINVDGIPGPRVNNIEVAANDSIYVFVTVSINPNASNLPFIVQDSIEINYNGNRKWIRLDAFGQNARFLRNYTISADETWTNDLPYVIVGPLNINENVRLTINKGSRIYFHADAPMIVRGSLQVAGEKWDSTRVVFTGDRLDVPYRDFPAGWPGIIFTTTSTDNSLEYATVKNSYQGIIVLDPSSNALPKLSIRQCIIDNVYEEGLAGINSSITAENLLISNCGKNIVLAKGGNYQFSHCTFATVANNYIQHKHPVLLAANFINQNNVVTAADLNAVFRNCIFWGDQNGLVENEVVVLPKNNSAALSLSFNQVLWRQQNSNAFPAGVTLAGEINNQNPQFDSLNTAERIFSFRLKETSPAREKGQASPVVIDLDGNSRPVGLPDLGAYEWR